MKDQLISQIHGSIVPAEGVKKVWAINDNYAVAVIPRSGKFSIAVKAGEWKLHVEAMNHYKYAVVDNIHVEEGRPADAGVIKLQRA